MAVTASWGPLECVRLLGRFSILKPRPVARPVDLLKGNRSGSTRVDDVAEWLLTLVVALFVKDS